MLFNIASAAAVLAIVPTAIFAAPLRGREVVKPRLLPKRASGSTPSVLPAKSTKRSTRSNKAKRQSSTTENVITGYVTVTDDEDNFLGYLWGEPDNTGIFAYHLTNITEQALFVGFEAVVGAESTSNGLTLFLQSDYSELDIEYPYVAAVNGYYNEGTGEIGDCSANYAYLSISQEAFSSTTPQNGTNLFNYVYGTDEPQENAIWSFNEELDEFAASWYNNDEESVYTSFVSTQGYLLLTGNATAFIDIYGGSEVFLGLQEYSDESEGTYNTEQTSEDSE